MVRVVEIASRSSSTPPERSTTASPSSRRRCCERFWSRTGRVWACARTTAAVSCVWQTSRCLLLHVVLCVLYIKIKSHLMFQPLIATPGLAQADVQIAQGRCVKHDIYIFFFVMTLLRFGLHRSLFCFSCLLGKWTIFQPLKMGDKKRPEGCDATMFPCFFVFF